MELILKRTHKGDGYTEGMLYLYDRVNNRFEKLCDTIEPQWRDLNNGAAKVMGRTAIPEGVYCIAVYHSPKWNRLMPYLRDVEGFTGVMIHPGNTSADTEGCILIGKRVCADMICDSRTHFEKLYTALTTATDAGEKNTLMVI